MPTTMRTAPVALAVLLAGCAASVSSDSPSQEPTAVATANPAGEATCQGVNAQEVEVPEPARSFGLAWNETDDEKRLALLETAWADEGTHVQPDMDVRLVGRQAFDEHIDAFQTNRPGEYFEWRGWQPWHVHHDRILIPWRLCAADGTTLLEGTDFGLIDADGRLVETTGFYPPE
jgi:hypothetical protein